MRGMRERDLKKNPKQEREKKILLGLVDLYLRTGKPIGSNTLKEEGFEAISSATIRNYFSKLEKEGYLAQQHTSGGRVPTDLAFKYYAICMQEQQKVADPALDLKMHTLLTQETKELHSFLEQSIDHLSTETKAACFLLSPSFDQDFITSIRLMNLDPKRILCVILTHFGFVHTEVLYTQSKLSNFSLHRIEEFFSSKLANTASPELSKEEKIFAERCFNEIALRNIIHFTSPTNNEIYRAGLSQLLNYQECQDTCVLSDALQIFDRPTLLSSLLKEAMHSKHLKCWIGRDLNNYVTNSKEFSILAIPYYIHNKPVGAVALLAPNRMNYRENFSLLRAFSQYVSQSLTKSVYKFNIVWHQPKQESGEQTTKTISRSPSHLLEDRSR